MYNSSKILLVVIAILLSKELLAQFNNSVFLSNSEINTIDSNKLFFELDNINMFKNNEYFGQFIEGYTIIGYTANPKLTYYYGNKTKISAGAHLLKYSGENDFTKILPIFSFQSKLTDSIDLVIGQIYGSTNHQLIESIFQFERLIENQVENGIQFLVNKKRFTSDIWLNWEQFILKNDPFQEIFTQGTSSKLTLFNNNRLILAIPLQTIISHHGGQVNSHSEELLQTFFNGTIGLNISYSIKDNFIRNIALKNYLVLYKDLSPTPVQLYKEGYAFFPNLIISSKNIDLLTGYWRANDFMSPRGELLFQSISDKNIATAESNRELITIKFDFHKTIVKNLQFGARFEGYYDLINSNFDYVYGLHLVFTPKIKLTTIPN